MSLKLLPLITQQFGLELVETPFPLVEPKPLQFPLFPYSRIERELGIITPATNEQTRRELIVGQILIAIASASNVSLFLGSPFEVNPSQGLCGVCDYLFSRSPLLFRIHPPVTLIVEVKRDLARALSHCLVEMVAAQQLNASPDPVYGAVTTGLQWQFLKLEAKCVTIEQTVYDLVPVEQTIERLAALI